MFAEDGNLKDDTYRAAKARGFRRTRKRGSAILGKATGSSVIKGVCRFCGKEGYVCTDTYLCRFCDESKIRVRPNGQHYGYCKCDKCMNWDGTSHLKKTSQKKVLE